MLYKMKIKVLAKASWCMPKSFKKGDWIDLSTQDEVSFAAPYAKCLHRRKEGLEGETPKRFRDVVFDFKIISLGVAMQLPKGVEAVAVPRSSLFKKTGLLQANSFGVIDNSYCGNDDIWGFPAIATREITIPKNTRICQFRIQLSQKSSLWQKLRWLFSSGIEIVPVNSLKGSNRKGFGEGTGGY